MADLLVTGGAGFIGSHFVRFWRDRHPEDALTVVDALTYAGRLDNLAGVAGVDFVHGDVRDRDAMTRLLADRGIDTIVHFAAETHVDRSIAGPEAFVSANVVGTQALLEAARTVWLDRGAGRPHRFHQVSTDEVYGSLGTGDAPFTERSPVAPNSPYAASKAAADHFVSAYRRTYGLDATISRCSNNYGPRQHPEKLIPRAVRHALEGRAIPLFGDGLNVRDWVHVDDHCAGLARIIEADCAGETFNLGGESERTNRVVLNRICLVLDDLFASDDTLRRRFPSSPAAVGVSTASLVTLVPDRPGHDRRYAIDHGKARSALGYRPARSFEDAVRRTIEDFVAAAREGRS